MLDWVDSSMDTELFKRHEHKVASHHVTIIVTNVRKEDMAVVRKKDEEPASAEQEDRQAGGKTAVRASGTGGKWCCWSCTIASDSS